MRHLFVVLPLLFVSLAAQNLTDYPIDNPFTNTSQNIPIAGGSITNWDEAHSQFFFPRQFLPAVPALLTGIEWASTIGGSIPYERFELYIGTAAGPGLTSTFANNINQPVPVYSLNPGTINWVGGNSWQRVTFTVPYPYDGVSDLVLEVRKKIDRPNNPTIQQATQGLYSYPNRTDLPRPIWAWGVYGSGAVDGPTASTTNNTLLLNRLVWLAVPTLTIDSTRNTTGNSNRGYFHIGATVTVTTHGNPGAFFVSAIDLSLSPVPLSVPIVSGSLWLMTPNVMSSGILDAAGTGAVGFTIPSNVALVGLHGYLQSAMLGGAGGTFTNVVDMIVQPF